MKIYSDIDKFLKDYNNKNSAIFSSYMKENGNLIIINENNEKSYCSFERSCETGNCKIKTDCKKLYVNMFRNKKLRTILNG